MMQDRQKSCTCVESSKLKSTAKNLISKHMKFSKLLLSNSESVPALNSPLLDIHSDLSAPPLRKTVLLQDDNGKIFSLNKTKKPKPRDGNKIIINSKNNIILDLSSLGLDTLSPEIGNLSELIELFLYENKLTVLPSEIGYLSQLQRLWLQENVLTNLPIELGLCKKLTHLDLRHNRLENSIPDVIKDLHSLKQLYLTYNKLIDISNIGVLKFLQTLVVKSNHLQGAIPECIGELTQLRTLDLSKNRLIKINENIGNCKMLSRFLVDYNQIEYLPNSIGELTELTVLGIKYNELRQIPEELANCTKLTELNIEGNEIEKIPHNILTRLTKVFTVGFSRNKFKTLPQDENEQFCFVKHFRADYNCLETFEANIFAYASSLTTLKLSNNNITSLNFDAIESLKSLIEFDMSYNQIDHLPESILCLSNLQILDMTNNRLEQLPASISELTKLTHLEVEFNQISSLPTSIGNMVELQVLNLNGNRLSRLPNSIGNLKNLQKLKVTDNLLQRLPPEMGNLKKLTHLYLSHNGPLDVLPIELGILPLLSYMSIDGCNLRQMPTEVIRDGSKCVIKYFRELLRIHAELCQQASALCNQSTKE